MSTVHMIWVIWRRKVGYWYIVTYYAKSNPFLRLECPGTTGKVKQTNKQIMWSCGYALVGEMVRSSGRWRGLVVMVPASRPPVPGLQSRPGASWQGEAALWILYKWLKGATVIKHQTLMRRAVLNPWFCLWVLIVATVTTIWHRC